MGSGTLTERLCNWLIAILNEKGAGLPEFRSETKYDVKRGRDNPESYYYCVDHAYVSVIEQLLVSITASNHYKSDVAILWNCVSAVLCEINFSPMENTVAKLFANLIDLLRYFRHFNSSITSWVGFTFPKDKVNDTNNFLYSRSCLEGVQVCLQCCLFKEGKYQKSSAKNICKTNRTCETIANTSVFY